MTIQTNRNASDLGNIQAQLTTRKEERLWAKELYTQFDAIVSRSTDDGARADRLAGLLALTELTDQPRLKDEMRRLIREQGAKYEASLAAKSSPNSPEVAVQLAQYVQLQTAAGAAQAQRQSAVPAPAPRDSRPAPDRKRPTGKQGPSLRVSGDSSSRISKWLWPGLSSRGEQGRPVDASGNEIAVDPARVAELRAELSKLGLEGVPIATFLYSNSMASARARAIDDLRIPQ